MVFILLENCMLFTSQIRPQRHVVFDYKSIEKTPHFLVC